jgi:hypothetical protein
MKRFGWLVAVLLIVLLSGALLGRAPWLDGPAVAPSPCPAHSEGARDALTGAAGWHYRHGTPTHWRSCLLQP